MIGCPICEGCLEGQETTWALLGSRIACHERKRRPRGLSLGCTLCKGLFSTHTLCLTLLILAMNGLYILGIQYLNGMFLERSTEGKFYLPVSLQRGNHQEYTAPNSILLSLQFQGLRQLLQQGRRKLLVMKQPMEYRGSPCTAVTDGKCQVFNLLFKSLSYEVLLEDLSPVITGRSLCCYLYQCEGWKLPKFQWLIKQGSEDRCARSKLVASISLIILVEEGVCLWRLWSYKGGREQGLWGCWVSPRVTLKLPWSIISSSIVYTRNALNPVQPGKKHLDWVFSSPWGNILFNTIVRLQRIYDCTCVPVTRFWIQ